MPSLEAIEQALREQPRKPPLEHWHPPLSGDISIRIDRRGDWYHEGVRIQRKPLMALFASILRREDDGDYYLVTPVEKWRIQVEDTPLIAVDMDIGGAGVGQRIVFRLNNDELVELDDLHRLVLGDLNLEPHPVLQLDRGLSARLTTAVYYRIIEYAVQRGDKTGLLINDVWYALDE